MKRFLTRLLCFLLALAAVPAGYFAYVQSLPAMYRKSLMGSVYVRWQLVRDTEGPRVIVVGGSSVPYSIECETVAEAAGMPCIAMGATAYLGMEYYLALIDDSLHEGDVVVLAPEFTMLEDSVGYSLVWMAVENSPELIRRLPVRYLPSMALSFYEYGREKLSLYRSEGAPDKTPGQLFAEAGFGPWGDVITPRESLLESGYDRNNTLAPDASSLSDAFVRAVNRFCSRARDAGATVVMTWAPFDELAFTGSEEDLDGLEARLKSEIDAVYAGSLRDCLLPGELFYDSNNHLTSEGARLRTQALLRDLAACGLPG